MEKSSDSGKFFPQLIKGILTGVIATIAGILVFAGIVNLTGISQSVIKGVNQFIKIISVFIGCLFSFSGEKGLLKGAITGLLVTVITYLIFLLFGASSFGTGFLIDLALLTVVGAISGIIAVNVKK